MFCISTKNFKFLGCADLTLMTIILGALLATGAIVTLALAASYLKLFSIYTLIFGICCFAVLIPRHKILIRQILLGMYAFDVFLLLV